MKLKEIDENERIEIKSPIKRAFGYNNMNKNSKNINNINELKNSLTNGKSNILGQSNINNLNINYGCTGYINIISNNFLNNNIPTTSGNIKENYNSNNNNNLNLTPDLNLNRVNQNLSTSYRQKPSDVGDYRKNCQNFRNLNFKNNFPNNYYSVDSPFYRLNSNSLMDYSLNQYPSYNVNNYYSNNLFKPMNSNTGIFTFDKNNLYNRETNPNANIVFKHMDSNDLNKFNKPSYLFPAFGYKRSTSFGLIVDGKIYDNNIN